MVDSSTRRLVRICFRPLSNQLVNSGLNYAVMPGLLPFLRQDPSFIFIVTAAYYVANMFGRWIGGYVKNTEPDIPAWPEIVAVMVFVFSACNGYLATMVPLTIKNDARLTGKDRVFVLQMSGLSGQAGSLIGTFVTQGLVSASIFVKK